MVSTSVDSVGWCLVVTEDYGPISCVEGGSTNLFKSLLTTVDYPKHSRVVPDIRHPFPHVSLCEHWS